MAYALRELEGPFERLHAAKAAAEHCRPDVDAKMVGQSCVCGDPVFDGDHREVGAVALAGVRVDRQRSGRAVTAAEVVDPDDKKFIGVERLARSHQIVPPADVFRIVSRVTGNVVPSGQSVADQNGVRTRGVQRAVGFENEIESREYGAAFQRDRFIKADALRDNDSDRIFK